MALIRYKGRLIHVSRPAIANPMRRPDKGTVKVVLLGGGLVALVAATLYVHSLEPQPGSNTNSASPSTTTVTLDGGGGTTITTGLGSSGPGPSTSTGGPGGPSSSDGGTTTTSSGIPHGVATGGTIGGKTFGNPVLPPALTDPASQIRSLKQPIRSPPTPVGAKLPSGLAAYERPLILQPPQRTFTINHGPHTQERNSPAGKINLVRV
jgi:hypothetical protein